MSFLAVLVLFLLQWAPAPAQGVFLVIPDDVPTGLVGIYSFLPPFLTGSDNRFGYGFRLGNHADFQILYEFGPQTATKPLQLRTASYRAKTVRRRPLIDFLVKTGILREQETQYDFQIVHDP